MQAITTERSHPTPLQPKTNTQERRQPAMMNSWQGYDNGKKQFKGTIVSI